MSHSLVVGIDFDDTLTAMPKVWSVFLRELVSEGHRFLVVTARDGTAHDRLVVNSFMKDIGFPDATVIYTRLKSKTETIEKRGLHVDIWIDDRPDTLVHGW